MTTDYPTTGRQPGGRGCNRFAPIVLAVFLAAPCVAEETRLPVTVVDVTLGTVSEEIPLTGTVTPIRITQISAKQAGIVESLNFEEGDTVKKGDVIAQIDNKLAELELARTRALYDEARARLKEVERQRDEAAELVEKKHISATTYETRVAEVEINAAVVQRLRTEVERQREILRRHTVYAPFDGVVTDKLVEIGQWINTDDPLLELTELDPLRIEVPVPQYYFGRIEVGTPVRIVFDALPDKNINANITATVPLGLANARTFPVKIDIENDSRKLAPGMSARVYLQLDDQATTERLLVPRDAIVRHPGGTETVWVLREQNGEQRAAPINVRSGRTSKGLVEIIDGDLAKDDRVIVRGNEILQPGQLVHVSQDQPPAL
ncbi:MAG: efflux RND transporter periplasmic adaptor subunit [Gammaproteobacteria bacterium]|nr:efflux RND transporter periplasmic adaptor subunit [Gammaproteobacteria bacterium]